MSFFDPPKFPEPFKPEPLWQMNTCPDCQNDLVCHDQGECLRPTPETDAFYAKLYAPNVPAAMIEIACGDERRKMQSFERERNKARELLASEKATRNAIIAKGIETERQLAEAREAFAIATDQLVQVQGELRQACELVARLRQDLDDPPADVQERVLAKLRSAYTNLNTLS